MPDLEEIDAFALTGSGIKWSAGDIAVRPYLGFLETIVATGKPIIGSCWGMQTIVQLFGGNSLPNTQGTEVGLAEDIMLTEAGRAHWIFEGMPDCFSSPCIHRDHVVELPDMFDFLASNATSQVQAVSCHTTELDYVGFQFHPEFELDAVKIMHQRSEVFAPIQTLVECFPENPPEIVQNEMLRTQVYGNWMRHVQSKKAANELAA